MTARPALRFLPYRQAASRPNIVVDGAPLASTVLTLSHWPVNTTPAPYKRDTSTETALAYVQRCDPRRVAGVVTNNHFNEDGLLSMFVVTQPALARRHARLLADAARAGDFGMFRTRAAARLCFVIEAHADAKLSPLPRGSFRGPPAARVTALYQQLLPRVPSFLKRLDSYRRYWEAQDEHLDASEDLIASGRVTIEEEPELDLAIVRIPEDLPPRTVWRYLRRERAAVHSFAIHNATHCARLLRLQGQRIEFQYRYESWLQIHSRRPALRVDLAGLCRWLNRRERNGTWAWEETLAIAPRLLLTNGAPSSLAPQIVLRELRQHLRGEPPVWDPHNWRPGRAVA